MRLYSFLLALARPIVALFFRFRVVGEERILAENACVFAVNHLSFWDPVFLGRAVKKRKLVFLARASLFRRPVVGSILRRVRAIPVQRDGKDLVAARNAIRALRNNAALAVFPQGTRCPDCPPHETVFEDGAAFLAAGAGVEVLPAAIVTKNFRIRLFRRVTVKIGAPIPAFSGHDKDTVERLAKQIRDAVCSLAEERNEAPRS